LRVGDQTLTTVITADAVGALKLRRSDDALAIVSTEVTCRYPVCEGLYGVRSFSAPTASAVMTVVSV
jgi:hypothetical protein